MKTLIFFLGRNLFLQGNKNLIREDVIKLSLVSAYLYITFLWVYYYDLSVLYRQIQVIGLEEFNTSELLLRTITTPLFLIWLFYIRFLGSRLRNSDGSFKSQIFTSISLILFLHFILQPFVIEASAILDIISPQAILYGVTFPALVLFICPILISTSLIVLNLASVFFHLVIEDRGVYSPELVFNYFFAFFVLSTIASIKEVAQRYLTQKIKAAQAETKVIFQNIEDGIFLLNRELRIGNQYSSVLKTIFNVEDSLAQKKFSEVLQQHLSRPKKEIDFVEKYLRLILSGKKINKTMLASANPIDQVEVVFKTQGKGKMPTIKNLEFGFFPLATAERSLRQRQVLVRVKDITSAVALKKEVAATERQVEMELKLIHQILKISRADLLDFQQVAQKKLDAVNQLLQAGLEARETYSQIYSQLHSLKGIARVLGFEDYAKEVHSVEDATKTISHSGGEPTFQESLNYTARIAKLQESLNRINSIVKKFNFSQQSEATVAKAEQSQVTSEKNLKEPSILVKRVQQTINSMKDTLPLDIKVQFDSFEEELIPSGYKAFLTDCFIQLTKNSLAHAFSEVKQRQANGKPEEGTIRLETAKKDGQLIITYWDDGEGLDSDQLRKKAVEKLGCTQEQVSNMSEQQLFELIFKDEFSTKSRVDLEAGRGVGLSMIKRLVEENEGKIVIDNEKGKFMQFQFIFPLVPSSSVLSTSSPSLPPSTI